MFPYVVCLTKWLSASSIFSITHTLTSHLKEMLFSDSEVKVVIPGIDYYGNPICYKH